MKVEMLALIDSHSMLAAVLTERLAMTARAVAFHRKSCRTVRRIANLLSSVEVDELRSNAEQAWKFRTTTQVIVLVHVYTDVHTEAPLAVMRFSKRTLVRSKASRLHR